MTVATTTVRRELVLVRTPTIISTPSEEMGSTP
jgi:hypothetical protein